MREQNSARFRFGLIQVFYTMALFGSSLGLFGVAGLLPAIIILAAWAYIFSLSSRPRALLDVVILAVIVFLLLSWFFLLPTVQAREPSPRSTCSNNLRQIMLALHNYHDAYQSLPPAYVADKNGKPMHSWRVLILPFIEHKPLYKSYNFSEPWDGPNNRKLVSKMPRVYACPGSYHIGLTQSSYSVVVGSRTVWPGTQARSLTDIPDGIINTIFLVEAEPLGANWMEPRDLTVEQFIDRANNGPVETMHRSEDFFYDYYQGRNIGMGDASIWFLYRGVTSQQWKKALTIDDGSEFDFREYETYASIGYKRLKIENCIRLALVVIIAFLPLPWVWINPRKGHELRPE